MLLTHTTYCPLEKKLRCGPCEIVDPQYEAMSNKFYNVIFVKVDLDAHEQIAKDCGVIAKPIFMFFKDGAKVDEATRVAATDDVDALPQKLSSLA